MKVGIFGTGAYGMALASIINDNNNEITMWTKFEDEKDNLEKTRKNEVLLPNFKLPENIKLTTDIEECATSAELLIIVIPAAFVRDLVENLKKYITDNQHILIASKGIEQKTGLFIHQIVDEKISTKNLAVISGPSFAKDIITKKPIGLSLATQSEKTEEVVRKALENSYVKLRCTKDIVGTEICGSIKNVIALASGMLDGLNANDSTRALLLTEALHDMEEILNAFNADEKTVLSYAGFGDLLLTCTSIKSRNFSFGKKVGEGLSQDELEKYLKETTVEGYYTLESIYQLLNDKQVNIPIINLIYEIIKGNKTPESLLTFLIEKK